MSFPPPPLLPPHPSPPGFKPFIFPLWKPQFPGVSSKYSWAPSPCPNLSSLPPRIWDLGLIRMYYLVPLNASPDSLRVIHGLMHETLLAREHIFASFISWEVISYCEKIIIFGYLVVVTIREESLKIQTKKINCLNEFFLDDFLKRTRSVSFLKCKEIFNGVQKESLNKEKGQKGRNELTASLLIQKVQKRMANISSFPFNKILEKPRKKRKEKAKYKDK